MDVETARRMLREISSGRYGPESASAMAKTALRALDGDGAEEWTAEVDGDGYWWVCRNGVRWLADKDESSIRRIARLPALERAADGVLALPLPMLTGAACEAFNALRAARQQEGQ